MFSFFENLNRRTFTLLSLLLILLSLPLTVLIAQKTQVIRQQAAQSCSQCIIEKRSDILDLYKANGWDTSAQNYDKIIENWCSIAPDDCSKEKAGRCASQCGVTRTTADGQPPALPSGQCFAPRQPTCTESSCGGDLGFCKSCPSGYKWCYAGYCIGRCEISPIEVSARPDCAVADSRIRWTWSGGTGFYTKLILIDDTDGQSQDFTPSHDQTSFTSARLTYEHNFRLQVIDDSGKQGEASATSRKCAEVSPTPRGPTPAGTITPEPTAADRCEDLERVSRTRIIKAECFRSSSDVENAFPPEDGWNCEREGRAGELGCESDERCWTCRLGPTPTPSTLCVPSDCSSQCAPGFACLQDPDSSVKSCECRRPDAVAPTAGPTPTPTVIPAGSTVFKVRLSLQEYTRTQTRPEREPTSGRRSRPNAEVTLVLSSDKFDAKTSLVWQEKTSDGNLGFYEGTVVFLPNTLPSGTNSYDILVKERNHLRKKVGTGVTIETGIRNEALILGDVANVLTVGDVSGNNLIDLADHAILVNCFGNKSSSDECNDKEDDADLDGDGKVTIFDYNWLLENFGKQGDTL